MKFPEVLMGSTAVRAKPTLCAPLRVTSLRWIASGVRILGVAFVYGDGDWHYCGRRNHAVSCRVQLPVEVMRTRYIREVANQTAKSVDDAMPSRFPNQFSTSGMQLTDALSHLRCGAVRYNNLLKDLDDRRTHS